MEEQNKKVETDYEEVNPEVWKLEKEGDVIEGVLVNKIIPEDKEESNRYYIETPEGIKMVWGSAILDDRLNFIDVGSKLKITFKERKDIGKGKTLKVFKVEREKKIV